MKKIFLSLLLIFIYFFATAQLQKGNISIGGGLDTELNFESSELFGFHRYYFNAAYHLTDRWAIGGEYHIRRLNTAAGKQNSYINWSANAIARYYFINNKYVGWYGEGVTGFGRIRANFDPLLSDLRFFNYGIGTGTQVNITKNIALDVGLRYTRRASTQPELDHNTLSVRTGIRFSFGSRNK